MKAGQIWNSVKVRLPPKLIPDLQENFIPSLQDALRKVISDIKTGFSIVEKEIDEDKYFVKLPENTFEVYLVEIKDKKGIRRKLQSIPIQNVKLIPDTKGFPGKYCYLFTEVPDDNSIRPVLIFDKATDRKLQLTVVVKSLPELPETLSDNINLPDYLFTPLVNYTTFLMFSNFDKRVADSYYLLYHNEITEINKKYKQTPILVSGYETKTQYINLSDNP